MVHEAPDNIKKATRNENLISIIELTALVTFQAAPKHDLRADIYMSLLVYKLEMVSVSNNNDMMLLTSTKRA